MARWKETFKQIARSAGVSVSGYPPPNSLAWQLRRLFSARSVDCVLDVGAFDGRYVVFLREEVGYKGPVISFEPVAEAFATMNRRLSGDHDWSGQPYALGREAGTLTLNKFVGPTLTSAHSPSEFGARNPRMQVIGTEQADVRRLGDVWDSLDPAMSSRRVFLKVDTQGSDLDVLEGAQAVLPQIVGLQIETPIRRLYADVPSFGEHVDRLSQRGFHVTGFFPISAKAALRLDPNELDCVLTRSPPAAAESPSPGAADRER